MRFIPVYRPSPFFQSRLPLCDLDVAQFLKSSLAQRQQMLVISGLSRLLVRRLFYFKRNQQSRKMKKFIYTLTKANYDEFTHERWSETVFESTRTFDNLFFEKKIETLMKINFFLNNRKWYFDKGIPYSLGIGLHGPPGTGKTSFIKALSNMTDRHIVTISLKLIKTKKQLDSIFFRATLQFV